MERSVNADMSLALLYFGEASVSFCSLMRRASGPVVQSDSSTHRGTLTSGTVPSSCYPSPMASRAQCKATYTAPSQGDAIQSRRVAKGERRIQRAKATCHKKAHVS